VGTEEVRTNREKVMWTFTAMTKHPECKEIWKMPLHRVIIVSDHIVGHLLTYSMVQSPS